jgi:major type 1 subunit fimbrin (pilin)
MMDRLSGTALLLVLTMGTALGADTGTITFSGALTTSSCTVDAGGASVTLPRIPISSLQTTGSTAGKTQFTLTLSGCTLAGGNGTVKIGFRNDTNIDQTTHNLKETADTTHVQIQLRNSAQDIINLVDNTNSLPLTPAGGNASFTLYAEYYAPGAGLVTSGTVTAALPFDLIYP